MKTIQSSEMLLSIIEAVRVASKISYLPIVDLREKAGFEAEMFDACLASLVVGGYVILHKHDRPHPDVNEVYISESGRVYGGVVLMSER